MGEHPRTGAAAVPARHGTQLVFWIRRICIERPRKSRFRWDLHHHNDSDGPKTTVVDKYVDLNVLDHVDP